jgi:hypothetical protein
LNNTPSLWHRSQDKTASSIKSTNVSSDKSIVIYLSKRRPVRPAGPPQAKDKEKRRGSKFLFFTGIFIAAAERRTER